MSIRGWPKEPVLSPSKLRVIICVCVRASCGSMCLRGGGGGSKEEGTGRPRFLQGDAKRRILRNIAAFLFLCNISVICIKLSVSLKNQLICFPCLFFKSGMEAACNQNNLSVNLRKEAGR